MNKIDCFRDLEFEEHILAKGAIEGSLNSPQHLLYGNTKHAVHAVGYVNGYRLSVVGYKRFNSKYFSPFHCNERTFEIRVDEQEPKKYQSPEDINKIIHHLKVK